MALRPILICSRKHKRFKPWEKLIFLFPCVAAFPQCGLGFSWNDARHYCQSVRTELTSIHSRAEIEFIRNLNFTKKHNIWIGLTRDRNFGWGWTDKTSLGFVNWAQGEPNSAFHPGDIAEENCVEMYLDGRWNDNNCLQKRGFTCRHRHTFFKWRLSF
uniref:C-type lectin domain-containing protein n=1 Tax=Poecilia reticulata TaxID=8081 RepID=A0A3P9N6C4_POERE